MKKDLEVDCIRIWGTEELNHVSQVISYQEKEPGDTVMGNVKGDADLEMIRNFVLVGSTNGKSLQTKREQEPG